MPRERSITIRAHLLLLAGCAALPVLVFAVLISIMLVEQEQRTFERGAIERARAMMSAVDADLRGSLSTLKALSSSRALAADDLAGFHESAVRLLATQPTWHNVTLALPSGQKVVDLRAPFGAPLGQALDRQTFDEVVKTQQPVIGNVSRQTAEAPPVVVLRVPIIRDGAVHYILTAHVKPESFVTLIREQGLPRDWVSGVVDGNGNFVARIPARPAGDPASAVFRAESARAKEGSYRGLTVEGFDTFTAYRRSALGNWTIGIGIPVE